MTITIDAPVIVTKTLVHQCRGCKQEITPIDLTVTITTSTNMASEVRGEWHAHCLLSEIALNFAILHEELRK